MPRQTHFKPGVRGLHFSGGKLYEFTDRHVLVIRPWPQPMAWIKRSSHGWRPTRKFANLLLQHDAFLDNRAVPEEPQPLAPYARDRELSQEELGRWYEWVEYWKAVAGKAFSACIPDVVRAETLRYSTRRMSVLSVFARCPGSLDLSRGNPALFLALANNRAFRRPAVQWPMRSIRQLIPRKQRVILEWLGFPATEAVRRTLAKIVPEHVDIDDLLYLRCALRDDPLSLPLLRHLPAITRYGLQLVTSPRLRPHLSPRLVQEANAFTRSTDPAVRPSDEQSPLEILFDTLKMCETVEWRRCPAVFPSLAAVRQLHDELIPRVAEAMAKKQRTLLQNLPPPPFPGTRSIVPLTTLDDLIREGNEQRNCVAVYAYGVAAGQTYIYRVESPVRGTLSLRKTGSGWQPDEFRLACNAPVPADVYWAVVRQLLHGTGADLAPSSEEDAPAPGPYVQPLLFEDEL